MIILGIGGVLGDAACAVLKDGELDAAVEESKLVAAPHPLGRPRRTAGARHRHLPATGGRQARAGGCGGRGAPRSRTVRFSPEAARAVSQQPHRGGGAPPGACRLGLLPFAVRRSHGADARPRRRFPLRLALAGARHAHDARTGAVLPGFARRSLRPRHRTAGLRAPTPTSTKCSGSRSPATTASRPVPGDPAVSDAGPRLDRSFFSTERLHATAASARASTSAWDWPTARRFPTSLRAARRRRHAARRRRSRASAWPATADNLCLAGGLGLNALLVSALENPLRATRTSSCSPPRATPARPSARCSTPGTASTARTQRVALRHALPGPGLHRRRNQAGARKLQAALPLPASPPTK